VEPTEQTDAAIETAAQIMVAESVTKSPIKVRCHRLPSETTSIVWRMNVVTSCPNEMVSKVTSSQEDGVDIRASVA
jgi:hypothetical protein